MANALSRGNCSRCAFCSKFIKDKSDKRYVCCNFQCPAHKEGPFEITKSWGCSYHFMPRELLS